MAPEPPPTAFTSGHPISDLQNLAALREYEPLWARRHNSDSNVESPWSRKIVLSLDGGGVRGYASLLILEDIMRRVREIERKQPLRPNRQTYSANDSPGLGNSVFDNAPITPVNSTDKCQSSASYFWQKPPQESQDCEPENKDEFHPHHYFDYFFGTSTGGLSAIMLGRLQMTVDEALNQYNTVCARVFQQRSRIKMWTTWDGKLTPRYSKKQMEEALQTVTQRDRRDIKDEQSTMGDEDRKKSKERRSNNVQLSNGNPDAARTAVLTYGGGAVQELRMLRSYRHPVPNTPNHANQSLGLPQPRENRIKPLAPCDLPLWMAGRATSAAPTYFEPMQIESEKFWDGGVGKANNPVKYAFDEVTQMHPRHHPLLIVSIGTGIQPPKDRSGKERKFRQFMTGTRDVLQMNDLFKKSILDSEVVHMDFEKEIFKLNKQIRTEARSKSLKKEEQDEACVKYFRFNIPASTGITDTKLGDWRGQDGADTILRLQKGVNECLRQDEDSLQRCAQILVDIRRDRQLTERWESFALHLVYGCPEQVEDRECNEPELDSRTELRHHLLSDHGIAWQVPCRDRQKKDLHDWTCLWGECGERWVSVFEDQDEYIAHLKKEHYIPTPQVVTPRQFEEKLDNGRKRKPPITPHPTFTRAATQVSKHSRAGRVLSGL